VLTRFHHLSHCSFCLRLSQTQILARRASKSVIMASRLLGSVSHVCVHVCVCARLLGRVGSFIRTCARESASENERKGSGRETKRVHVLGNGLLRAERMCSCKGEEAARLTRALALCLRKHAGGFLSICAAIIAAAGNHEVR
jgi:hypothetical protein